MSVLTVGLTEVLESDNMFLQYLCDCLILILVVLITF